MALKRINKELTDLGRYVHPHHHTATVKFNMLVVGLLHKRGPMQTHQRLHRQALEIDKSIC
jgi:hypothetical protein